MLMMTDKNNNHLHAKYIYGNEYHFYVPTQKIVHHVEHHLPQSTVLESTVPKLQLALNNSFSIDLPAFMKF